MPDTQRLMTDATGQSIASALTSIAAAVKPDATELNMGPSDSTKVATKITEQSQTIGKILPVISGSTNNSGYAISAGEYFEADGALYKATASIPTGNAWSSSATALSDHGAINALNSNITKITLPTKITCSSQSDFETKANTLAGTLSNGEIASVAFGFPSGMIFNGTSAWGYINRYSATRWNMILTSYDDSTYVVNIQYNNGTFKYTDLNSKLSKHYVQIASQPGSDVWESVKATLNLYPYYASLLTGDSVTIAGGFLGNYTYALNFTRTQSNFQVGTLQESTNVYPFTFDNSTNTLNH